jgi:hypothetical protein
VLLSVTNPVNLSGLDGVNGFAVNGAASLDFMGQSVSGVGDLNGDGFDDFMLGAHRADANGTDSGAIYVIFGQASGFPASLNVTSLDGTQGFQIKGVAAGDFAGL